MRELWKVLSCIYMTYITYLYIYCHILSHIFPDGLRDLPFYFYEFWCQDLTAQKKLSGCAGEKLRVSICASFATSRSFATVEWLCWGTVMWPHTLPDCFRQEDCAGLLLVSTHTSYTSVSHLSPVLRYAQIYPHFQVSAALSGWSVGS